MKPKDALPTRNDAVLAVMKVINQTPLTESVSNAMVWEFSESVGGGWGWKVVTSKFYGSDAAFTPDNILRSEPGARERILRMFLEGKNDDNYSDPDEEEAEV